MSDVIAVAGASIEELRKLGGRWLKLQEMHNEASDPLGARLPRLDSYPA